MEKYVECQSKGMTLRGMMHIPDTQSEKFPMVIFFHGFCDERSELNFVHTELSRKLCKNGIASVRFDFSGSGESDGDFEKMTISGEVEDGENILEYVKTLDFVDKSKIALHGLSMGGCVASMLAGKRNEDICALSLFCPAPDVAYNLRNKRLCGQDVSNVETLGYMDVEGLKLGIEFYKDAISIDPFAVAAKFTKNVNIVHGDADLTASVNCAKEYKKIYQDKANLLILNGADHRFTTINFREQRILSALQFLTKELL